MINYFRNKLKDFILSTVIKDFGDIRVYSTKIENNCFSSSMNIQMSINDLKQKVITNKNDIDSLYKMIDGTFRVRTK